MPSADELVETNPYDKVCEVCGEPANCMARDFYRDASIDKPGPELSTDGPPHFYCEKHHRESRITDISRMFL